jgi:hypothetical protein
LRLLGWGIFGNRPAGISRTAGTAAAAAGHQQHGGQQRGAANEMSSLQY